MKNINDELNLDLDLQIPAVNKDIDNVVIVDPGKNAVKVLLLSASYTLLEYLEFPSLQESRRNFYEIDSSSNKQFQVEFEDKNNEKYYFLVGDGVNKSYNFDTTKNNNHHKICIYTAIANLVDNKNKNIHLVIGCPSSDYTNPNERESYKDLITCNKNIKMTINGEAKSFNIKSCSIQTEGIGIRPRLLSAKNAKYSTSIDVIDIGGKNANFRSYDKASNLKLSFSLDEAGMNYLEEDLKLTLRKFVKVNEVDIESFDYQQAIAKGSIKELEDEQILNYSTTSEFVEDRVLSFLENELITKIQQKGKDISKRGSFLIFTGGGSILLEKYLKDLLPNNSNNMVFSETAKWDNVISYATKDLKDRCLNISERTDAIEFSKKILKEVSSKIVNKSKEGLNEEVI